MPYALFSKYVHHQQWLQLKSLRLVHVGIQYYFNTSRETGRLFIAQKDHLGFR